MTGFKNFILRGNLVELAVAVIMASPSPPSSPRRSPHWLTSDRPDAAADFSEPTGRNSFGACLTAVIAFVIMAAVVYFFVVVPYTKAKEKYFPSPEPGTPEDIKLLQEIRDLLAAQSGQQPPSA